jgi:hypothetical protein
VSPPCDGTTIGDALCAFAFFGFLAWVAWLKWGKR